MVFIQKTQMQGCKHFRSKVVDNELINGETEHKSYQ